MMSVVLLFVATQGVQAGADFTPMRNRGPRAWDNVASGDNLGTWHPEVARLLVHTGTYGTQRAYLPAVRKWLEFLLEQGWEYVTVEDLDRLMMKQFDAWCYEDRLQHGRGLVLFNAMMASFPEMAGHFPRANRCLKGWRKVRPPGQGGPMPEEAAFWQAVEFIREGRVFDGWIVFLSVDCYLRSQDWKDMRPEDVSDDRRSCAIRLGASERGSETKTGPDQGVVVCRGFVADGLVALRDVAERNTPIFPTTPERFRRGHQLFWSRRKKRVRSIHKLRHTGAAEDLARGRRSQEGIRVRGRWRHLSATERYTRTHLLVEERATFGPEIVDAGADIILNPRKAVIEAIRSGPARRTVAGKALLRAMENPRIPDSVDNLRCFSDGGTVRVDDVSAGELRRKLADAKISVRGSKAQLLSRAKDAVWGPEEDSTAGFPEPDDWLNICTEDESEGFDSEAVWATDADTDGDIGKVRRSPRRMKATKSRKTARAVAMRH
jgi:hypothetical protein